MPCLFVTRDQRRDPVNAWRGVTLSVTVTTCSTVVNTDVN